jgi:hypothetical protein
MFWKLGSHLMIAISMKARMIFQIVVFVKLILHRTAFVYTVVAAHMQEANQCLKLQCYRLRTCYCR